MRSRRCPLALALLLAAAAPRPARADEAEAAARFKEGAAAYARHDFEAAARAFEAAHAAEPSGAVLYNAGLSWEETGAAARAADDYDQALALGGLSAAQVKDARKRLGLVVPRLGLFRVDAPPGARLSIDGGAPSKASMPRYAVPGEHALEITFADGRKTSRRLRVGAGAAAGASFAPPPVDPVPVGPQPAPGPPPPSSGSPVRTAGFVVLGAGVAAGGAAIGLGVTALGALSTFNKSNFTDAAAHDRAATFRTATNVTIAAAGALGAAGIVMIVVGSRAPSPIAALRMGPRGVELGVRF